MKKFKFELEDVMKYREYLERQAELELGKAMAKEKSIQNKIDELANQSVSLKKNMAGSTDFQAIVHANEFYTFIGIQKDFLLNEMAKAKLISAQKREVMQEAMQKTESLHKLSDRQLEEYKEKENNELNDIADDINNSRTRLRH